MGGRATVEAIAAWISPHTIPSEDHPWSDLGRDLRDERLGILVCVYTIAVLAWLFWGFFIE